MVKRASVKQEAKKLLDHLLEEASWDDIMYRFYVRQKYERGIAAADLGDGMMHHEVTKLFGPK